MTIKEAAEFSRTNPENWVVWCGNRVDVFFKLEEAKQHMDIYWVSGKDAYGYPLSVDSGIWHAGEKLAA